ncbi:unnamed protein product [Ectocarpus sp. CCAP 1310/34]|nr:unnamed protein product [Ectocarpus sp. CCAP 1310/34]
MDPNSQKIQSVQARLAKVHPPTACRTVPDSDLACLMVHASHDEPAIYVNQSVP